jgi:hypothetical protein
MRDNSISTSNFNIDYFIEVSTCLAQVHGSAGYLALAVTHFFASCYWAIKAKKSSAKNPYLSSYKDKVEVNYALCMKYCAVAKALDATKVNASYREYAFWGQDIFAGFNQNLFDIPQDASNPFTSWEKIVDSFEHIRCICFPDLELPECAKGKSMFEKNETEVHGMLPKILSKLESQIQEQEQQQSPAKNF